VGMDKHGAYCVLGAIKVAAGEEEPTAWYRFDTKVSRIAVIAVAQWLPVRGRTRGEVKVYEWNDDTDDDFEVIDTLRHVAKDLRNAVTA